MSSLLTNQSLPRNVNRTKRIWSLNMGIAKPLWPARATHGNLWISGVASLIRVQISPNRFFPLRVCVTNWLTVISAPGSKRVRLAWHSSGECVSSERAGASFTIPAVWDGPWTVGDNKVQVGGAVLGLYRLPIVSPHQKRGGTIGSLTNY